MHIKARSRLQPSNTPRKSVHTTASKLHLPNLKKLAPGYIQHWPLLAAAILTTLVLHILTTTVSPAVVQNLVFTNSYLPFIFLLFSTLFFWFSYAFLNTRRGIALAYFFTFIVFCKFQQVVIDLTVLLLLVSTVIAIEVFPLLFRFKLPQRNPGLKKRAV